MLTEAHEQGGLLSMRDLSLIMCYDHSYLSELRQKYEKRKDTTLHFVGYDHDMGTAISHKTRILRKIFVDKKDPVQVARETDHSPENGMGKEEMRIVTGMKAHLISEYLKIIEEHNAPPPSLGYWPNGTT